MIRLHTLASALLLLTGSCAPGLCGSLSKSAARETPRGPGHVSLEEVAQLVRSGGHETVIYDANPRELYQERHVPGARWIHYDALAASELPANKSFQLIFYCANPECSASEQAAEKALALGATRVGVMSEGIFGWVAAGLPTESE